VGETPWHLLDEAGDSIESDDLPRAHRLVLEALDTAPDYDPLLYSQAISILTLAGMYDDAEAAHLRYTEATGERLRADVTLEEIRETRAATRPVRIGDSVVFRRLTLVERGHFSNYFTFRPVTKLALAPDAITIWRRRRSWTFPWPAVTVQVAKRRTRKAIGRYAGGDYLQKVCTIRAEGLTFRFDVSDQYPDIGSPREFLALLTQYVPPSVVQA
jgi:hypothetical protein